MAPAEAPSRSASTHRGLARVLVTEDQPEMLRMIDRALGNRYRCEFAATTAQAHSKLASTTFQLALCNIQMPGASGLALAEEITERHPETAVVLITEEDDPEVARKAFGFGGHGVHGYLVKPFWPGQLLITAMNALRRRELETSERSYRLDLEAQAIDELRLSRQETVERLTKAIELHDSSTGEHVDRMADIASLLATRLGLDTAWVELLRLAAPMHDVGKIATPDGILRKPGPLTPEEREEMKRHTTVGHEILADSKSELLRIAASIALTHHERWDGSGYPRGLSGGEIPLEGRISAVADVFDASLSDRCYRSALTKEETVEIIKDGRGGQFDPQIADVLLQHLGEALLLRA